MQGLWLLLLPVAALAGWLSASRKGYLLYKQEDKKSNLPRDYLLGLNFLLNEEPDKALDVFIKMLEVDSETVETHLALGNLFRRRGEIERATRIHQNLIARPNLNKEYRAQALFALAHDYLSAGVLDRAERLFLELVDLDLYAQKSLNALLDIYQQEKEWQKAIMVAQKIKTENMRMNIAHFYCELAEESIREKQVNVAAKYLKRAISIDKQCVRANLLLAGLEKQLGRYKQAVRSLKRIKEQNIDFFSEAILPLSECYQALGKEKELVLYFKDILHEYPRIPIVIILSERIRQWRGDQVAANFVADYVRKHPSILGLHRLLELYEPLTEGKTKNDLRILLKMIKKLLLNYASYRCINCGFAGNILHWQCPSCKRWNSVKPTHTLEAE